jgi:3-hydroxyisobutyrate dehydrogenase-like beta-hydroxyacid dehydrogenase
MGGQRIFDFGEDIGAASATKLVGNFMIISAFVAMQEAFTVLERSGIDPKPTLEMLTTTLLDAGKPALCRLSSQRETFADERYSPQGRRAFRALRRQRQRARGSREAAARYAGGHVREEQVRSP